MGTYTKFPEKHREAITAWLAGKDIEYYNKINEKWTLFEGVSPAWHYDVEYRVYKEKVVKHMYVICYSDGVVRTTNYLTEEKFADRINVIENFSDFKIEWHEKIEASRIEVDE